MNENNSVTNSHVEKEMNYESSRRVVPVAKTSLLIGRVEKPSLADLTAKASSWTDQAEGTLWVVQAVLASSWTDQAERTSWTDQAERTSWVVLVAKTSSWTDQAVPS